MKQSTMKLLLHSKYNTFHIILQ